jgi:hypothetical protein
LDKIYKIYLDTSVINFLFADDAPEKKFMDAYHIAVCVVNGIDYLVSWNYKHLANIQKERQVKIINLSNNYFREFRLITPLELLNYE